MMSLRLALRNLTGAGLRTWLNVTVLSMAYVVIIWQQGLLEGWNRQAERDMIGWEVGAGQYWHPAYDPYDPFTIEASHGPIPPETEEEISRGVATPILIGQAAFYPQGRMKNVVLKGIAPDQKVLKLPSEALGEHGETIPLLIGTRMARSARLGEGQEVTLRWKDVNGAFDAAEARVVRIMKTDVPAVDQGILWIPIGRLREMLGMPGEATLIVVGAPPPPSRVSSSEWTFRDQAYLLRDVRELIRFKSLSGYLMYGILLSLALLAIFDTQVLSIFRRRREIGTLMALGMTRGGVIRLFTLEGAMHGILAALAAAAYGIPLLRWQAVAGYTLPKVTDTMGLAIAEKIFPSYSAGLVLGTTAIVLISVTVVSFIPSQRIARLSPTDAIRGKLP